eukprot:70597-Chlamydomonas_euryale.AAC.1
MGVAANGLPPAASSPGPPLRPAAPGAFCNGGTAEAVGRSAYGCAPCVALAAPPPPRPMARLLAAAAAPEGRAASG